MKICHLTSVHGRNDPRIRLKECVSLARAGHEVILLVADGLGDEETGGIKVVDAGKRPGSRLKRFLFSAHRMLVAARAIDAELYHFHDPELIPAGLALRRAGKLVIYDAHEDLPRQLLSKPYLSSISAKILSVMAEIIEDYSAHRFSAVIAASDLLCLRFRRFAQKAISVNNYPSLEELGLAEPPRYRKAKQACYVGGISEIRCARVLAETAKLCRFPIVVAGPVDSEQLKAELFGSDCKLDYRGVLGRREISELLCHSMVGLVVLKPVPSYLKSLPTKMFEYMAAGIPVIASNFPFWKVLVEDSRIGVCVDPEDPVALANAIEQIIDDPRHAEEMGARGRQQVLEQYNWESEARKLNALYTSLLTDRN